MGPMRLGQSQQRPVTARDHLAAPFFLDGGEGQVEMKEGEELQRRRRAAISRWRSGAFMRFRSGSGPARHWPPSAPLRGWRRVASTMAPEGRLSPAGGMSRPAWR